MASSERGKKRSLEEDDLDKMDSSDKEETDEKPNKKIKKTRRASKPPLSRTLISLMIDFLIEDERRPVPDDTPVWSETWKEILKSDTELAHCVKGLSFKQRFFTWLRVLDLDERDGQKVLILAESRKLVPCKEEIPKIIRDAHRATGEFKREASESSDKKGKSKGNANHNSAERCIKLIKDRYAFGSREFGVRKSAIYREVMRCPECFSEGRLRVPGKDVIKEVEMVDPDFGNEMNFISLKNAPVCMTMRGPSQNSVWYDQTGLANEDSLYKKLLGVIKEVGMELGRTAQNDVYAKERLMTKICCAEKLVWDLKKNSEKEFAFRIPCNHFLEEFSEFQQEYLHKGDSALYLHDMNYITNTYRKFRNHEFVGVINNGLQELTKNEVGAMRLTINVDGLILEGSLDGTFPVDQSKKVASDIQQVSHDQPTKTMMQTATATAAKPEATSIKDNENNS